MRTRRVEVDVWPNESQQPDSVKWLFGSSDMRVIRRPRQMLSTHHQAIMVLADFFDRLLIMPKSVKVW